MEDETEGAAPTELIQTPEGEVQPAYVSGEFAIATIVALVSIASIVLCQKRQRKQRQTSDSYSSRVTFEHVAVNNV